MSLPEPYASWLTTLCGGPVPAETRADCANCVMCGDGIPGGTFNPVTRCCTYVPRIPNFMLGRIFKSDTAEEAEGRGTIADRLAAGAGITPLGLEVSDADQADYDVLIKEDDFGKSTVVRCPHLLQDGRCGIWRHRNGICATWFCRHEQGGTGQSFWEAVQLMFTEVERALGYWAARQVRWPEGVVDPYAADRALYTGDWGQWKGREVAFFEACAEIFKGLSWTHARQIGGDSLRRLSGDVIAAYDALSAPLSSELEVQDFEVFREDEDASWLIAYSPTDPLQIPTAVADELDAFDGRPVLEVLTEMLAQGIEVDTDLLRALHDFELLLPPDEEEDEEEDDEDT